MGVLQVRHFAHVLRMVYEAGTINSAHGWIRKYPMEAHDLLPQLYYRGAEEHAPGYCRYYPAGRGMPSCTLSLLIRADLNVVFVMLLTASSMNRF